MKIPNRKTANIQVQEQKRQQIAEGITIAKKVDALRNDLLNLQNQRQEFIEGSKAELDTEIAPLIQKRDSLLLEVKTLESIKSQLKSSINNAIETINE